MASSSGAVAPGPAQSGHEAWVPVVVAVVAVAAPRAFFQSCFCLCVACSFEGEPAPAAAVVDLGDADLHAAPPSSSMRARS